MGVIIAFTRLANDSEILALKACGVSSARMFVPVVLVALATSLLTGFIAVRLIPAGEQSLKKIMFHLVKDKVGKTMTEHKFSENMGSFVVYVEDVNRETGEWAGVYVADMRFKGIPLVTIAQSGYLKADARELTLSLVFRNGSLHRVHDDDSQTITFSRYELDLPVNSPELGSAKKGHVGSKGMTMQELQDNARIRGVTTKDGLDLLTEFHKRLVLPVGCFILTLLGLPLGLSAGTGKRAVGVPLGLLFFVLYYVGFSYANMMAEEQILPVLYAMWLPNVMFMVLTIFFLVRAAQDKPLPFSGLFSSVLFTFASFFSRKEKDE
jgi:lipopolysaccharide export system permease protein